MTWAILQNTPLWAWGILAVLLALGLAQARNRKVSGFLILLLPAIMIPLSLYSVAASFGASLGAPSAWAIGLGAALTLNQLVFLGPRGVRYNAVDGSFQVSGSWIPLVLMLTIFSTRFVLAVLKALNPSIVSAAAFIGSISFILGFCSGLFLSRAMRALNLRRGALA